MGTETIANYKIMSG